MESTGSMCDNINLIQFGAQGSASPALDQHDETSEHPQVGGSCSEEAPFAAGFAE